MKPKAPPSERPKQARRWLVSHARRSQDLEAVIERENLKKALAQVKRNKGTAGVDGMTVGELPAYLKEHWPTIRARSLEGAYKPQPVRREGVGRHAAARHPDCNSPGQDFDRCAVGYVFPPAH
ncbi:hypothetical protein [Bradyrhizobium sp. RDI18]|uniref:hypothetical protein n=1 Tax=Bradyrhizobium sp. RDI18 TaxID=3367400 RepID=UPI003716B148